MAKHAASAHKLHIAHPAPKNQFAAPVARQGGVALNLGHETLKGNGDSRDAEFEKF
jgi:hypothetical protein